MRPLDPLADGVPRLSALTHSFPHHASRKGQAKAEQHPHGIRRQSSGEQKAQAHCDRAQHPQPRLPRQYYKTGGDGNRQ